MDLYIAFLSRGTLWISVHCDIMCYQWFAWWLCLEIINKLLSCISGLIAHHSHDHSYPMRWNLAWSSKPRAIDGYFAFLLFPNNRTNSCLLLTKLLVDGLVAHSSLVQIYNLVPDVLWQLFGSGEVEIEDTYSMDKCLLYKPDSKKVGTLYKLWIKKECNNLQIS